MTPASLQFFMKDVSESIAKMQSLYPNYFEILRIIGSSTDNTSVRPNDIDVLVVLNDKQSATAVLSCIQNWIINLRMTHDFYVISDSYFYPSIPTTPDHPIILHLILFTGLSHFKLSPYARLFTTDYFDTPTESLSMQRLSYILAAQDVLKFWCMHYLNSFPPEKTNRFIKLQNQSIDKWFTPIDKIQDRFIRDLITFIRKDCLQR